VVGILGGIGGLAIAGGPLVGGAVVQGLDWHWIFWLNVPVGLVAAVLSASKLPESRGPASRLDVPGVVLAAAGAAVLAWGLVHTADVGWASTSVLGALILGAVLLTAFALWERRAPEPMLPIALLRIRAFTAANIVGFMALGSTFSAAFLMSQYFQFGLGYSPLATGLRFLPWTMTPLLIAPAAGTLSDRIGRRPLMLTGLLLQTAGLGWIALHASATSGYAGFVLPFVVAGVGVSMVIPTAPAAALSAVPAADLGKASGVQNTLQRFGSVVGVAVVTAVFGASGHLGSAAGVVAGFRPGLAASAGMALAGALAALAVGRRVPRSPAGAHAPALVSARR
jgi:MFS family permease